MSFHLNLEQLRKQAKEHARARGVKLTEAQFELAREHGFASWPKLKLYVERLGAEQPFRSDVEYYEGRAEGIATTTGIGIDDARRELADRHGFSSWRSLRSYVGSLPETPFVLAYRAVEDSDVERLGALLDRYPELVRMRGTNGNDLLGMANKTELVRLLLERGADPNHGNDYGWTRLHQAGQSNQRAIAQVLLDAGARTDLSARGDGGTPLVVALFWGHREVVDLLGREPRNVRVAAGLGDLELIREIAGTPQAGAHREFYRPHGGFPAWQPSDQPQEVLDEALVWAAKADRVDALHVLVELGARVEADPYRGTALTWAAYCGRTASIQALVELGADVNQRASFGGPDHGEGVTALHLAAQAGKREAVETLLELGADPTIRDALHDGPPAGWADFGGHPDLAEFLKKYVVSLGQQNAPLMRSFLETRRRVVLGSLDGREVESALVAVAVAAGELAALERFYRELRLGVFAVALAITGDRGSAEDVLHDTFVRIAERADRYRPGTSPRAWVYAVARNVAIDSVRKRVREQPVEVLEQPTGGDDRLGTLACLSMLMTLTDQEREIVVLHALAGLTHREIADELGIPAGTVRWKYRAALTRLAPLLEESRR